MRIPRFCGSHAYLNPLFSMARKKKKEKEVKDSRKSPAQCYDSRFMSEDEFLFALLLANGFTAAKAYRMVYRSVATNGSCAVMASRRVRDIGVQNALGALALYYWSGDMKLKLERFQNKPKMLYYNRRKKKERMDYINPIGFLYQELD